MNTTEDTTTTVGNVNPLMQPIHTEAQWYHTSQYFHVDYRSHMAEKGWKPKHARHDNFLQTIRAIPLFHHFVHERDILIVQRHKCPENLRALFQGNQAKTLYLLNATAQAGLTQHLDDPGSMSIAYHINQQAAQRTSAPLHRPADLLRQALEELRAKKDLLLEMGYHPALALLQATKHAESITGLDLSAELNGSPLMLDIPPEQKYLAVSILEKRFEIPPHGTPGTVFNKLLADYGLQSKLADGTWHPTERALAERYCMQVLQKNKSWQGYIWHWQLELAARIAEWAKRSGRLERTTP